MTRKFSRYGHFMSQLFFFSIVFLCVCHPFRMDIQVLC